MSNRVSVNEYLFLKLNHEHLEFQTRTQHAEKRWNLVKSKFPGVAETIEDLIEKEERTNV